MENFNQLKDCLAALDICKADKINSEKCQNCPYFWLNPDCKNGLFYDLLKYLESGKIKVVFPVFRD